jgi:thymidylate kinase
MDDLYPKQFFENRKKLTVWDVLPDIIFLLSAPKEILFSRLDKSDQKYLFRKTLIEKKGDWYGQVIGLFPQTIKNRIVAMDATESPAELHTKVVKIINAYRNDQ